MRTFVPNVKYSCGRQVYAVDFQRGCSSYKFATSAPDNDIHIWELKMGDDEHGPSIKPCTILKRHASPVNVVRFSHSGKLLASGDTQGVVHIWQYSEVKDSCQVKKKAAVDERSLTGGDRGSWVVKNAYICRAPSCSSIVNDVTDLCWSSSDNFLAVSSMDGGVVLWDTQSGKPFRVWQCKSLWAFGVACHPSGQFVATIIADGTMRIFRSSSKRHSTLKRFPLPSIDGKKLEKASFDRDDSDSFRKSPAFSPDGNVLIVPNGTIVQEDGSNASYASYVFYVNNLKRPCYVLPSQTPVVLVRFCPVTFQLVKCDAESMLKLGYRFVFAILSDTEVFFYDTEHPWPIGCASNYHTAPLTDAAWSNDGSVLAVSSLDGLLSFVCLAKGELGVRIDPTCWIDLKSAPMEQLDVPGPSSSIIDVGDTSSCISISDSDSNTDEEKHCPAKGELGVRIDPTCWIDVKSAPMEQPDAPGPSSSIIDVGDTSSCISISDSDSSTDEEKHSLKKQQSRVKGSANVRESSSRRAMPNLSRSLGSAPSVQIEQPRPLPVRTVKPRRITLESFFPKATSEPRLEPAGPSTKGHD